MPKFRFRASFDGDIDEVVEYDDQKEADEDIATIAYERLCYSAAPLCEACDTELPEVDSVCPECGYTSDPKKMLAVESGEGTGEGE